MTQMCPKCKTEKPLSEFYSNRNAENGKSTNCAKCMRAYQKRYRSELEAGKRERKQPKSTTRVMEILQGQGIPITSGKSIGFPWCDLAAWGCVPIEAKGSKDYGNGLQPKFTWMFSPSQRRMGFPKGSIIVFVGYAHDGRNWTFIVPASVNWLADPDRKLQVTALSVTVDSQFTQSRWWDLREYQNAFSVIESARVKLSRQLRQ